MYLMAGINQRTNRVKSKDDVVAVRGEKTGKERCLWLCLSMTGWSGMYLAFTKEEDYIQW